MPALPGHVHQFGLILLMRVDYGLTTLFALVHPEASTTAGQCYLIGVAEDAAGGVQRDSTLQRDSVRQTSAHSNAVSRITRPKLPDPAMNMITKKAGRRTPSAQPRLPWPPALGALPRGDDAPLPLPTNDC